MKLRINTLYGPGVCIQRIEALGVTDSRAMFSVRGTASDSFFCLGSVKALPEEDRVVALLCRDIAGTDLVLQQLAPPLNPEGPDSSLLT